MRDGRVAATVDAELEGGLLWPEPLVQLNPSFAPGGTIDELVAEGTLHPTCTQVFRVGKGPGAEGAATKSDALGIVDITPIIGSDRGRLRRLSVPGGRDAILRGSAL